MNITVIMGDSSETSSSGASKPSGLKQPTKIGRPCLGQQKPAIPHTPKLSEFLFCFLVFVFVQLFKY